MAHILPNHKKRQNNSRITIKETIREILLQNLYLNHVLYALCTSRFFLKVLVYPYQVQSFENQYFAFPHFREIGKHFIRGFLLNQNLYDVMTSS